MLDRTGRARFAIGLDDEDNYLLFQSDAKQRWSPVPSERTGGKLVPFAFSPSGDKVFAWFAAGDEPLSLVQAAPDGSGRRPLVEDGFASIGDLQWTATPAQEWRLADGKVNLDSLPPGQWTVDVTSGDGRNWQGAAVTKPGSPSEVILQ